MKKYSAIILAFLLIMSGCTTKDTEQETTITTKPVTSDGYRIVIPFSESDATQTHITFNRSGYDVMAAGEGLMRYSKEYFSVDNYYLQDGQLLDRDQLQVNTYFGDQEGLLGFKSDENPYGLNPEKGSQLPIDETTSIAVSGQTIPIVDIIEYNFHKTSDASQEIEGISLAIIVNRNVLDEQGNKYVISDENLQIIGEEASRNIVSYIKSMPEVSSKTPIMVALFSAESSDSNLAGHFFSSGYGVSSIDQFKAINEQWVLYPGDVASTLDPSVSSQFEALRKSLHMFLPNDVSIVGKGLFLNNQLNQLDITIQTQAKTYVENLALVQQVDQLLTNFTGDYYGIHVTFQSNTESFAVIQREIGSQNTTIIMQ